MCGIWFFFDGTKNINKSLLYSQFLKIQHRGPDSSVFKCISTTFGDLYIGFHRLAIMDPSPKGDQPFYYQEDDQKIYSICNGEIYNVFHLEHTYDIKRLSHSDCEIIPPLYLQKGMDEMLKELNGEFAMVLVDITSTKIQIHLAQDRFGIRPLFYSVNARDGMIMAASELKSLSRLSEYYTSLPELLGAGQYATMTIDSSTFISSCKKFNFEMSQYYIHSWIPNSLENVAIEIILGTIRKKLIAVVEMMMESDRPLGALLSGGLDSSLIVAIASRYLKRFGKKLYTFSIGMNGSTDRQYAEMVAAHCGTIHTHFECTIDEFLDSVDRVIYTVETYDITTIRASVGQYLAAKKVKENSGIKVLLIGDGSDELTGGYLYFHKAPNSRAVHDETTRLLDEIPYYDVRRADRGIAAHGLEARVPFLNHIFVDYYMSLPHELKLVTLEQPIEKWLLRKAFDTCDNETTSFLPNAVLWRRKEAFSDGVSSNEKSWYQILGEKYDKIYENIWVDPNSWKIKIPYCSPPTREALQYRLIFRYKMGLLDVNDPNIDSSIIPGYWLPRWVGNTQEPSARVLDVYTS